MLLVNLSLISVVSLQVDRLYGWRSLPQNDIINVIKSQSAHTKSEFDERATLVMTQLAEEVKRSDDLWLLASFWEAAVGLIEAAGSALCVRACLLFR